MGKNHVHMDGHLLPFLQSAFRTEFFEIRPAWLGLWQYFTYIGMKLSQKSFLPQISQMPQIFILKSLKKNLRHLRNLREVKFNSVVIV